MSNSDRNLLKLAIAAVESLEKNIDRMNVSEARASLAEIYAALNRISNPQRRELQIPKCVRRL